LILFETQKEVARKKDCLDKNLLQISDKLSRRYIILVFALPAAKWNEIISKQRTNIKKNTGSIQENAYPAKPKVTKIICNSSFKVTTMQSQVFFNDSSCGRDSRGSL
jgi:hypothetical protein